MFAIVDIETTGGFGVKNCITEIAIILHNGQQIEHKYTTLINPEAPINWYVQNMTGITNKMVANAPKFVDVASHIHNLLKDRIFIAHNVNFDYSFVKQHLQTEGYTIDLPKICTVKLSRKIFPGLPKYGLSSLSKHFNIENTARHRAIGDAQATAQLFEIILANDKNGEVAKLTKRRKAAQYLPPNITTNIIANLPSLPGVYYFYNNKQKVIYVGKAINLKKRVASHFANNKSSKQKQDFLKEVYNITHTNCSSDLAAMLLESIEIHKIWPKYNKSQKHYERQYGIFLFEDSLGYQRLAIDNAKKVLQPLLTFSLLVEARNFLQQVCTENEIHPSLFFLSKEIVTHSHTTQQHNNKIKRIIEQIESTKKTYLIHDGALTYILIEQGKFYGFGKIDNISTHLNSKSKLHSLKNIITAYPPNNTINTYLQQYILQYPESVIELD